MKRKYNLEKYFCIVLFILSILFSIVIFIKKPMKSVINYLYIELSGTEMTEVEFPLKEKILLDKDINSLKLDFGNDFINNYSYDIQLIDQKGKDVFKKNFQGHEGNIVFINPENGIKSGKYNLVISCSTCKNVKINLRKSKENNYLVNNISKSLDLSYESIVTNMSYYWYSIMGIIITLTLYPLLEEDSHE